MQEHESNKTICVIGLGYVGLTLAVALASTSKYKVIGVEQNVRILQKIQKGESPFIDLGLNEALQSEIVQSNFETLNDIRMVNKGRASNFILAIGTPFQDKTRTINLEILDGALERLEQQLVGDENIILRSTVPIGTTRKLMNRLQEQDLPNINFYYAPERTIEGLAYKELFLLPQILGGGHAKSEDSESSVQEIFESLTGKIVRARNFEEAEAAKLISNVWRDYTFAFSNQLATSFANINLNAAEVITLANEGYARSSIPSPGYVGGPCLSKDTDILELSLSTSDSLFSMARKVNEDLIKELISSVNGLRVGIMGLAFKGNPETDDLRSSYAEIIAEECLNSGAKSVFGWDPVVHNPNVDWKIEINSIDFILNEVDVLIIQNNHTFFSSFEFNERIKSLKHEFKILDIWNVVSRTGIESKFVNVINTDIFGDMR